MTPEEARELLQRTLKVLNSRETRRQSEEFHRRMLAASTKDMDRVFTI